MVWEFSVLIRHKNPCKNSHRHVLRNSKVSNLNFTRHEIWRIENEWRMKFKILKIVYYGYKVENEKTCLFIYYLCLLNNISNWKMEKINLTLMLGSQSTSKWCILYLSILFFRFRLHFSNFWRPNFCLCLCLWNSWIFLKR